MKKLMLTISLFLSCISLVSCGNAPKDMFKEDSSNTVTQSQRESSSVAPREQEDKQESFPESETQEDENNKEEEKTPVRKNLDKNTKRDGSKKPKLGIVKELVNGDLMCYVTLVDKKGIEHNVGASFDICADEKKFVNKKVRAVYEIQSVNDCESAEPCGKTRKESIITKMEVVSEGAEEKSPSSNSKSGKSQTLSNGEWTIK